MKFTGPFRDPVWNAWWNITICGLMAVIFVSSAIRNGSDQPHWWGLAALAIAGEGVFIYSLFTALRDAE